MSLTFFVAPLHCPVCGSTSPADTSTNMSNKLLPEPGVQVLQVGDPLDLDVGYFADAFVTVRLPGPGEPIHVLETWECPTCHSLNWAEITVAHGAVRAIEAVTLSQASLDRANFITDRVYELFERLTGQPFFSAAEARPDFVPLLRAKLPAATPEEGPR